MARSKNFFSKRHGSTKSHTYSVDRGYQITKDRVRYVTNPQTNGQMRHRMLLSSVSSMRSLILQITKQSFQGLGSEKSTMEFMRVNTIKNNVDIKSYALKGSRYPSIANYIVSHGELPSIDYYISPQNATHDANTLTITNIDACGYESDYTVNQAIRNYLIDQGAIEIIEDENGDPIGDENNLSTYRNLKSGKIQLYDQLTFLMIYQYGDYQINDLKCPLMHAYISRLIFNPFDDVNSEWEFTNGILQNKYMMFNFCNTSHQSGGLNRTMFVSPSDDIYFEDNIGLLLMGAVIHTRPTTRQISTQRMAAIPDFTNITFNQSLSTYIQQNNSNAYLNSGIEGVDITGGNN